MSKKTEPVAQQLSLLPYEAITSVASRQILRDNAIVGRQTAFLDISTIHVRGGFKMNEGFNPRFLPDGMTMEEWKEELGIEELAYDMLENGQNNPLEGDLTPDGTTFYLTEGFRRKLAIEFLIAKGETHYKNGKELQKVEVMPNPREWTEEDRLVRALSSDNKLKFKPIEIALKIKLYKNAFKRSNEEIGSRCGNKSRQWVENMLTLAEQPETIQKAIADGKITATAALALAGNVKDETEREKMVSDAISTGGTITVKQAQEKGKTDYDNYKERFQIVVDQFKDGVISHSAAATELREISLKAIEVKADDQKSIEFAYKAAKEWLDEAEPEDNPLHSKIRLIVQQAKEGSITYDDAIITCNKMVENAVFIVDYNDEQALEDYISSTIMELQLLRKQASAKIETSAAIDAEEESRKTPSKTPEYREKNQKDDALQPIDFKKDKVEGEMDLNEVIKLLDKLNVNLNSLPSHMEGYKKDWQGLIIYAQKKLINVIEIIKKAPDQR